MADPENAVPGSKKLGKHMCAAWNCNNYRETRKDISFFRFRLKNFEKWVVNLRRQDLIGKGFKAVQFKVVCAEHFEQSQFMNKDR